MKRSSFCTMAISLAGALSSGAACAQSSVTLYGIVDAGLAYVNNQGGHSSVSQTSGVLQGSRFGFRGSEDLGGGYKTIFVLENGFNVNNGSLGQGGLLFGRQAYVGLSTPGGTVSFGRQYDFLINLFPMTNITEGGVYSFHLGDYDRLGGERLNNAVSYQTPVFNGLQAGAMYSLGGVPGSLATNSAFSGGIWYSGSAINFAAAYTSINNTSVSPTAGLGVSSLLGSPAGTATISLDRLDIAGVGASYAFQSAILHAVYTRTDFRRGGASAVLNAYEAGATWYVTPTIALLLGGNYYKLGAVHWVEPIAVVDKFLSKRTDLYAQVNYLHASGSGVKAVLVSNAPSSGDAQLGVTLGIRHKF
ncbi:outer membrane protein OmpU [Paraburkholderia eburnea]|uniref:Outer membrane protein OmpU n=1 Tax=Paraburkholderia eburnea TaxID=1189126 RepID=A0A2S4LTJ0_9BURK|nr:porin [Paraburkholderia eburnea]POR45783.1 outer membrane protein OmpU [Paraburkholderia eburnea]PRZ14640.1 outer membrane protein OmpU [Paraburkholderia eburnea]